MGYVTPDKYSPYPRCCDICGQLRSIATMRKLDGVTFVCDKHTGERTRIMLDTLNAHAKPPQTWPVANPRPQNPEYPNTLEADEGALFNFIDRQIQARCRWELVQSGAAPYTSAGQAIPTMAWAGKYLYDLIVQGTRLTLLSRARVLLAQAADYILTRQYGSSTGLSSTSTRANDAFYGAVLESGETVFVTDDIAASGLALLYAYRLIGATKYIVGARAAASFLRNVQAIGSNGSNFTSTDSAGVHRLYTGALASQVSTTTGVDVGERMFSNHLFYPSCLSALDFWNQLKTTDGDQMIGASAAVNGFTTTPEVLMSTAMSDLRSCWETGITDSTTATVINGFSIDTPREFFNAYPASKPQFTSIVGTGRWEFSDGNASLGTQITSQNFARGLAALYSYEGQSTQVAAISDWLRTFTSNEDFETADGTSPAELYHETTGTYDPTVGLATVLTVRDADDSYSAIAENGSSLYDWGAYGLLSPLWFARYQTSFKTSRLGPLNIRQRFYDGTPSDNNAFDRLELRGISGLSYQSGFASTMNDATGIGAFTIGSPSTRTPPTEGLVFWVKGDVGLESSGGFVTAWRDQGPFGQDLLSDGNAPFAGTTPIGAIPTVFFPHGSVTKYLVHSGTMKDRTGAAFTASHPRTVMAIIRPQQGNVGYLRTGGAVFSFRETPCFQCLFSLEGFFHPNGFYLFDNAWPFSGGQLLGPDTTQATYNDIPVVAMWSGNASTGATIAASANGTNIALTPSTSSGVTGAAPPAGFILGDADNNTGTPQISFQGNIAEVLVWDWILTGAEVTQALAYAGGRSGVSTGVTIAVTNDALRASQLGAAFRQAH